MHTTVCETGTAQPPCSTVEKTFECNGCGPLPVSQFRPSCIRQNIHLCKACKRAREKQWHQQHSLTTEVPPEFSCKNHGTLPASEFRQSCIRKKEHLCKVCKRAAEKLWHQARKRDRDVTEAEAVMHHKSIKRYLAAREGQDPDSPRAQPPDLDTIRSLLATLPKPMSADGKQVKCLLRPSNNTQVPQVGGSWAASGLTLTSWSKHALDAAFRNGTWSGWRRVAVGGKRPGRKTLRRRVQKLTGSNGVEGIRMARPVSGELVETGLSTVTNLDKIQHIHVIA
jgi:hypothetical protein